MQNGGVAYTLIPAIKKLYSKKEDRAAALKRHLEFFNTHPFMANPIFWGNDGVRRRKEPIVLMLMMRQFLGSRSG